MLMTHLLYRGQARLHSPLPLCPVLSTNAQSQYRWRQCQLQCEQMWHAFACFFSPNISTSPTFMPFQAIKKSPAVRLLDMFLLLLAVCQLFVSRCTRCCGRSRRYLLLSAVCQHVNTMLLPELGPRCRDSIAGPKCYRAALAKKL